MVNYTETTSGALGGVRDMLGDPLPPDTPVACLRTEDGELLEVELVGQGHNGPGICAAALQSARGPGEKKMTTKYRIEYYEPDGSSSPLEFIAEPLHNTEYPTLRAAKHAIRATGRGRGRHGQWSPDEAVTAYHESRQEGCGGYAIVDIIRLPHQGQEKSKMTCERCNTEIVMHANGDLACSCDYVDHRPLGEIPEHWDFDEEVFRAWSESENPGEDTDLR